MKKNNKCIDKNNKKSIINLKELENKNVFNRCGTRSTQENRFSNF